MCVELGGCLTGEHGVGIEKRDLMTLPVQRRRSRPAEARARGVRSRAARLNPAKVFPLEGSARVSADEVATLPPSDEAEAGAMVAEARAARRTLDIVGGGTRAGLGRPRGGRAPAVERAADGIVFHEPAEMVLRANAGTPLADVEATLAAHGQMLPFEPMDPRALYGGAASRRSAGWSRPTPPGRGASAPARRATA